MRSLQPHRAKCKSVISNKRTQKRKFAFGGAGAIAFQLMAVIRNQTDRGALLDVSRWIWWRCVPPCHVNYAPAAADPLKCVLSGPAFFCITCTVDIFPRIERTRAGKFAPKIWRRFRFTKKSDFSRANPPSENNFFVSNLG